MVSDAVLDTVAAVLVTVAVREAAARGKTGLCESAEGEGAEEEEKGDYLHGALLWGIEGLDEWYRLI